MSARPLRQILTLQVALVAVLPFLLVALVGGLWVLPQLGAEIQARQGQLAQAVAAQTETYLTSSLDSVHSLAAMLGFEEPQGGHLRQVLQAQVRPDGVLRAVYVLGEGGRVREVALAGQDQGQRQDLLGMDLSRAGPWRQAVEQGRPVWSDTFLSVVGGGLSVALAVPAGRFTVMAELRLDTLSRHLGLVAAQSGQVILVLDRRGQVIADQDGSRTAQQLNLSHLPLVRQGPSGAGPVLGDMELEGVAMIGGLVRVPNLDWQVLVALPTKQAYQTLWAVTGTLGAALVLTLLAGGAAALWLSRRLAGRFELLAQSARRIASGQEVALWPDSRIREFQGLSDDLRLMAQAVRQREESLARSEAKFRRLTQSSPLGLHLYRLRPDGRLILSETNPAADAILGLEHARLLGLTIAEAFPGLAAGEIPQRYRQVAGQGGLWQDHLFTYQRGSQTGIFEARAFQSEPGQVAVLFSDITQRRQAEEAIRQSEARLRSIYQASPAGIGMSSVPQRRVVWANQRLAEMAGYDLEEMVGLPTRQLYVSEEEYRRVGGIIEQGARGLGVTNLEAQMARKDGTSLEVLLSFAPMEPDDPSGGLVFMLLDISQSKRLARERDELQARLRQAQKMEAVGTLAGGIAHDFNNILAIIMGNADMAREEVRGSDQLAEMLERILSACRRGKGLINQILAFSRQRGRQPLALEPALIWKETLGLLRATLPANIKIDQHLPSGGPLVLADPTELHQMLVNLCGNAAHAMGQEGGTLGVYLAEVQLAPREVPGLEAGAYLRLTVSDTGQGMDQTTLGRIFDPYFSTKPLGEGTGLGLAVVHGLVRALGGAISAQSQPGQGATFHLWLPTAKQVADAAPADSQVASPVGAGHIMLVDDEPDLLGLGRHMLSRLGYQVSAYANGALAWRAFAAAPETFDVVVTDLAMPEMSGLGLARRIRELPSAVPIILCSGYLEPKLDGEIAELEVAEVLGKPYSKVRLAAAVQRVLAARPPRPAP